MPNLEDYPFGNGFGVLLWPMITRSQWLVLTPTLPLASLDDVSSDLCVGNLLQEPLVQVVRSCVVWKPPSWEMHFLDVC